MPFDLSTLFFVTLFVSAIAGLLLVFSWWQNRAVPALLLWGCAYLICAVAMLLLSARGRIPDVWAAEVGMALWISAHGLMWRAARNFEGRRTPLFWTLAGPLIWLGSFQFDLMYQSLRARLVLSCLLIGGYLLLTAAEICRARDRELVSRWPAIVLLGIHAASFLLRIPFADILPFPGGLAPPSRQWIPVGIFEIMFHTFCMSVLLVNMAKERAELYQRTASLLDPLTGIANRRAFFERAKALLADSDALGRPVAFLLFDLDRFKNVNDSFGHQFGDLVLSHFCDVAHSVLRPGDLFGRFGGEEFGCLLPNTSQSEALALAERIRSRFAGSPLRFGATPVAVTVSAGVAPSSEAGRTLDGLFAAADRALYRAKAKGRDRVEGARVPLTLVERAPVAAVPA